MRLTWLGHSTVLIEDGGGRLLTDPVLRARVGHLRRNVPVPDPPDEVDAVLLSHVHYDHLDLPSLRTLGRDRPLLAPRGAGALLHRKGFTTVEELLPGDRTTVGGVAVRATHADHDAQRSLFGKTPSLGYVVEGELRAYFAGDTGVFPEMADIGEDLDVALLPVAGWGRRLPPGHLDPAGAVEALALLRPRAAVPIHWGTYRQVGMSSDPERTRGPAEEFRRLAGERAPEVRVILLAVGESTEVAAADLRG
ncbi:MAG TPA: MBL fold metallo-hydrolase [Gaiellales bacterium]|nr:MBL fold metallo-hydrolase [Gaiellales bacterium]